MNVTGCLVTRGDVDLRPITDSLAQAGITDLAIWNNALEGDEGVFGRYRAVEQAHTDVVFVQDDDCVLTADSIREIVEAYQPGVIVANMPAEHRKNYTDSCLVGFGAVFDRDLPGRAFARFDKARRPWSYRRRPDVIFTALTPFALVNVPVTILPYAYAKYRQYRQPEHVEERHRALQQARIVRARK